MDFSRYFSQLLDWKKLPAYKLENRVDSFIGYYLKDILAKFTGKSFRDIIPEFPLRVGTIYPSININKSYKVDFLGICEKGSHILVEIKTDLRSRRDEQDNYLEIAKEIKLEKLIDGLQKIYKATKADYKDKYRHLIDKLIQVKIMDDLMEFCGDCEELEIIYIQPSNPGNKKNIIDFDFIIDFLKTESTQNTFEEEFIKVLQEWKKD